jgi:hypothetical protein
MRFISSLLVLGLLAASLTACNGGDDGDGGGASDEVTADTNFFEGPYDIGGTVTFASPLPSGTRVQLNLTEATDFVFGALDSGNELSNFTISPAASQVRWTITGIAAGSYLVALSAELSGDGWIGEGDQGGYYAGTIEQPAQLAEDAQVIEVSGTLTNLDFGAGPIQCKAHWGDACSTDDDCRGASCVYDSGLRAAVAPGKCTAGACEAPSASCEPFGDGESGMLEENDCFGGP